MAAVPASLPNVKLPASAGRRLASAAGRSVRGAPRLLKLVRSILSSLPGERATVAPRATSLVDLSCLYFVTIADRGLVGVLGDSDKVSHVFQPDGRSCPSNSQYAFRLR